MRLSGMAPTGSGNNLVTLFVVGCALLAALPPLVAGGLSGQQGARATCATGTSAISIQEVFVDEDGGDSPIYCRGTAAVRQCEGECFSRSIPRAGLPTGYSKLCNCCKEGRLEPKEVTLTDCYDASGNALIGRRYPVQVPEPVSCSCQECSL